MQKRVENSQGIQVHMQQSIGSRIRRIRLDLGLRQADVAQKVGISASYLNLIEHNKRRIGEQLTVDLATVLNITPDRLLSGATAEQIHKLRTAAAKMGEDPKGEKAEDLVAQFPSWAKLISDQADWIGRLEQRLRVASDRMVYDPQLAASVHEVISSVSAIRSTASILMGSDDIDAEWQRRFHKNIYSDSVRLATSSEALTTYLDALGGEQTVSGSAIEQFEQMLTGFDFHIPDLEDPQVDIERLVREFELTDALAAFFRTFATKYKSVAERLPLDRFESAAVRAQYNPADLAKEFGVPMSQVLRRLASLPAQSGHPPIGMVTCDASGFITLQKPVAGLQLPRAGGCCPLWPIFGALSRPGQPILADVALPEPVSTRYRCYAIAEPVGATEFRSVPQLEASMILIADGPHSDAVAEPVGVACRICSRGTCAARREPAVVALVS